MKSKHRKRLRKLFCIVISLSLVLSFVVSADAFSFSLKGCKLKNGRASWTWGDRLDDVPSATMRTVWERAVNDWTNATTLYLYYSAGSSNKLNTMYRSSSTYYGETQTSITAGYVDYFESRINLGNSNVISNNTVARSVAVHELGHPIGLDDLTSGTAVMNTNRDRTKIYVPQNDDIMGVRAIYDRQ